MPFRTVNGKKIFIQEDESVVPEHLFDDKRLTKHDDRYFLVQETFPNAIAVDEFTRKAKDLFEFKRNVIFTQDFEGSKDLFDVVGGGKDDELDDEKKFLEGLQSAGALDE